MDANKKTKRTWKVILLLFVVMAAVGGIFTWYKFFREVEQEAFASEEMRFRYGSLRAEADRGIPYWIWLVLPRVFPDLLPGPGGYKSLGAPWEPGEELPAGFSKKIVGFPRVTNNCAVCHTAQYRVDEESLPVFVTAGPNHTLNAQGYFRFLFKAAADPRFNANELMREINLVTELSWIDKMIYRCVLIPFTRKALLEQADLFKWMDREGIPDWGVGRDDPMNLTKYFMTTLPYDQSTGQADFPSVWNLKLRENQSLNFGGETPAVLSVIIDSALGLGAAPDEHFMPRMRELEAYLKQLPPPKYPFPIDQALAAQGAPIYGQLCADCHEPGRPRAGKVVPIEEIGTDRERLDTWTQAAADAANAKVKSFGIERTNMVKTNGYVSEPLDGLWLRAPYFHNGSVPNLREVLEPVAARSTIFYRGYDVYDPINVGFVTQGARAEQKGQRYEVTVRGNGNQGHLYGTDLSAEQKAALLEYLKTL
jgi:hypothetical protein